MIQDNPEFKKKKMKFTPNFYDGDLLAAYIVDIDESGYLRSYRILKEAETDIFRQSQANLWFAFVETDGPDPWFNGQTYVDTLNKDAMAVGRGCCALICVVTHLLIVFHKTYLRKVQVQDRKSFWNHCTVYLHRRTTIYHYEPA